MVQMLAQAWTFALNLRRSLPLEFETFVGNFARSLRRDRLFPMGDRCIETRQFGGELGLELRSLVNQVNAHKG